MRDVMKGALMGFSIVMVAFALAPWFGVLFVSYFRWVDAVATARGWW